MGDRIVVLVDMDCFYCQVEVRHNPSLRGKPMAVVQYNQWQGGGIIAVNYEARGFGVTRHIRGNEAKKKCPDIVLVHVPSVRGKADLTRYRDAGREVVEVLCRFSETVQRASVDEAYLDITQAVNKRHKKLKGASIKPEQLPNTFIVGVSPDSNDEDERQKGVFSWLNGIFGCELKDETSEKLAVAACIVEEMRASVFETTGFRCSAGIAHNKILAKLACGLHKPQRQTVLPQSAVSILYCTLPVYKVRGLGGKFGDLVKQRLNINYMGDLIQFSESQLQKAFDEKSGTWLFNIARGFDEEPVTSRLTSKSIGCCKKFPGKLALATKETVEHWLGELAEEVAERLEKELSERDRRATQFVVSYMQTVDGRDVSSSRCGPLNSLEPKQILADAMELLKRSNTAPSNTASWIPPLKFLGLSAGKFAEKDAKNTSIQSFFKTASKKDSSRSEVKQNIENTIEDQNTTIDEIECEEESNKCTELPNNKGVELEDDKQAKLIDDAYKEELENEGNDESRGRKAGNVNISPCNGDIFQNKVSTPKLCGRDSVTGSVSNSKKSFFINFFKLEGLIKTPTTIKKTHSFVSNNRKENEKLHEDEKTPTRPTGKSQEPTTSEGHRGITDRSVRLLQVDDSSNDSDKSVHHWVSPGEIFPNLDEIDDDVAALLPSPMQRQLRSRLDKLHESRTHKKNKGIAKSKSKKCLVYDDQSKSDGLKRDNTRINQSISDDENCNNTANQGREVIDDADKLPSNLSQVDIFANNSPPTIENNSEKDESNVEASSEPEDQINSVALHDIHDCTDNEIVGGRPAGSEQTSLEIISDGESENDVSDKAFNIDESLKELCPHCNQLVPLMEYPEHLDFHVAAELDKELNQASVQTMSRKTGTVLVGSSPKKENKRKRGRPSEKKTVSTGDKKMRSITNFFAPVR